MTATATSKESYKKLTDLGERQRAVHKAIGELGTASNREIARYLDVVPSDVTGRVKELRDYGFVAEHGKKWDNETKRNVIAWCVIDPYAKKKIDIVAAEEIDERKWETKAVSRLND